MKQLRILFACVFVVMVGYGITLTVLPFYAERVHGLATVDRRTLTLHIGFLTSVYAFAQLVAAPILGRLADKIGRRPVLLSGLAGMAVTQMMFGFVPNLWLLYVMRTLGGIATAGMLVASTTYVADATTEADRARGMAWFGTAVSLGLVAGPALGGILSRPGFTLGSGDLRLDGYSLPFLIAGLLALVVLVAARRLPESRSTHPQEAGRVLPGPSSDGEPRQPGLRTLLSLVVASQFGLALFEGTFVLYAQDRIQLGPTRAAAAFMVCGVVMAAFQVVAVGALARVIPSISQIAVGLALMGGGIAALIATRAFTLLLGAIGVLALGTALVTPNLSALISSHDRPRTATALGLKSAAGSLGQFGGPVTGSIMLGWRPDSPFAVVGVALIAIGVGVGVGFSRRRGPTISRTTDADTEPRAP